MVVQFITFMVKFYYNYGRCIYYICGQKLLHLWSVFLLWSIFIAFMVFITFMGDTAVNQG